MTRVRYSPSMDGVDHINIHLSANTRLGRLLSEGARTPFTHPTYGQFASYGAFRVWCRSGKKYERLKVLWGKDITGKGCKYPEVPLATYVEDLAYAMQLKIDNCAELKQLILENELPLVCYFVFNNTMRRPNYGDVVIQAVLEYKKNHGR